MKEHQKDDKEMTYQEFQARIDALDKEIKYEERHIHRNYLLDKREALVSRWTEKAES